MTRTIRSKEMRAVLLSLFNNYGFSEEKAKLLAEVHTENTLHGVNSHGINRVPFFIEQLQLGLVKKDTEAEKLEGFGSLERWDGGLGSGVLNAIQCTNRAIAMAKENGMGLVALRNTNHWMRAGYYGWMLAEQNCMGILFTNTEPNMPAWGGKEARLGNNPLVIAIPRKKGHIVLDMAMTQFSFGKINEYKLRGDALPNDGGFDADGNLTKNPKDILTTKSGLPIGYWKGSAIAMVLDMLATLLSAGRSTYRLGLEAHEYGVSQIFLCMDSATFQDGDLQEKLLGEIISYTKDITPTQPGGKTYYPGEKSLSNKIENEKNGMQVSEEIWNRVIHLLNN
ncbi:Malate/L-lactate dehydrogenase [Croceitalea dokdonensis DOKDO 023]|uniref:Malate/L-lactate dehydrogenase n=1 Tax=Croceitalea dokdonensis DOKDO 023 TaxID=1300341 RepID=A0A0P7ADY9_9FLAO|nr:3-dehydro-L-gulonate 2-dehydrogenase [Croceitalea dokdonensis]KPM30515.1 Malate/L-lactate dehydrogenase [Croceitalea dokdonensis DOKDO 023]